MYPSNVTGMTYDDYGARAMAESNRRQIESRVAAQADQARYMRPPGLTGVEAPSPATHTGEKWVADSRALTMLVGGAAGAIFAGVPCAGIALPWSQSVVAIGGVLGCAGGGGLLGAVAAARATDEGLSVGARATLGVTAIMLSVAAGFSSGFGLGEIYSDHSADQVVKVNMSWSDSGDARAWVGGVGVLVGVGLMTLASYKVLVRTSKLHFLRDSCWG